MMLAVEVLAGFGGIAVAIALLIPAAALIVFYADKALRAICAGSSGKSAVARPH
ncbi:hypothetical protein GCM10027093_50100 [Paraburkholderia jirisanensis]